MIIRKIQRECLQILASEQVCWSWTGKGDPLCCCNPLFCECFNCCSEYPSEISFWKSVPRLLTKLSFLVPHGRVTTFFSFFLGVQLEVRVFFLENYWILTNWRKARLIFYFILELQCCPFVDWIEKHTVHSKNPQLNPMYVHMCNKAMEL